MGGEFETSRGISRVIRIRSLKGWQEGEGDWQNKNFVTYRAYNGATVVGGKQRGRARATEENGPTSYALDPKLSKRRTRENERESRLY